MTRTRALLFGATLSLPALIIAFGCATSAETGVVDEIPNEPQPDGGGGGTVLAPPSTTGDVPPPDAGPKPPPKKDAAPDAPPPPRPEPGDPCPTVNTVVKRECNACGKQEALCEENPDGGSADGGPGVVSAFSPCANEVPNGCIPGTTEPETCGKCGTRTRTCTNYCAWSSTTCTGEPPGGCLPNTVDITNAGCPTADVFRTRSCNATCGWTTFSSCGPVHLELTIPSAVNGEVSAIYPLRAGIADKRLNYGTCGTPTLTLSTATNHPYHYVELKNPTSSTATVTAYTAQAPGGPVLYTIMAAYAGNVRPTTEDERKACTKGIATSCPATLCGTTSGFSALTADKAVSIPPGGSSLIYFAASYPAGGSTTAEGDVKFIVRTDALN